MRIRNHHLAKSIGVTGNFGPFLFFPVFGALCPLSVLGLSQIVPYGPGSEYSDGFSGPKPQVWALASHGNFLGDMFQIFCCCYWRWGLENVYFWQGPRKCGNGDCCSVGHRSPSCLDKQISEAQASVCAVCSYHSRLGAVSQSACPQSHIHWFALHSDHRKMRLQQCAALLSWNVLR